MNSNLKKFDYLFLLTAIIPFVLLTSCEKEISKSDEESALKIEWADTNSIVCYGTSLTYGLGAGCKKPSFFDDIVEIPIDSVFLPPFEVPDSSMDSITGLSSLLAGEAALSEDCGGDSSYPRFLQERLLISVVNSGSVGASTEQGGERLDSVFVHNPVVVLLEFGGNDFLWDIDTSTAKKNLSVMIERILHYGSEVVLLSFIHPDMIEQTPEDHFLYDKKELALEYYSMFTLLAKKYGLLLVENIFEGIWMDLTLMSDDIHPNGNGYMRMEENISRSLMGIFRASGMLR